MEPIPPFETLEQAQAAYNDVRASLARSESAKTHFQDQVAQLERELEAEKAELNKRSLRK